MSEEGSGVPCRLRRAWGMPAALLLVVAWAGYAPALGTGKPLWEYGQQAWQSDSGLPQNTVRAIAQTKDGYLWIGTEAGLVRFDGIDFEVFDAENTPALHSDLISSLQAGADGSLWIGTSAGLVKERAGVFTVVAEGVQSAAVLGLYVARDGRLLSLTAGGAAMLDASGSRSIPIPGTEHLGLAEGASMVAEDLRGRVWIAGPSGVASLDPGAMEASPALVFPEVGEMHALAAAFSGELWVGGANGLAVLARGVRRMVAGSLPSVDITSLLAGPDGGMWIGTSKGLALAAHGAVAPVRELSGRRVQSLFLDRAGTLWVGTSEGLARILVGKGEGARVDLATRAPVMSGVLSVFEDREGSMWFGTDTAGLHVLRDQAFSTVTMEDGLSASLVRAVFEDHAGTMWIGTSGGGLDRLTGGRATPFAGGLPSRVVLALAETPTASGHDLWVGTPEGLVRIRGSASKVFTTADGLADDFVRSLYADRDGSLWIGTRNGLSHWKDGVFHSYSRLDGLASDLVGTILRDRAGTLWAGTLDGLSRMAGDGFVPATVASSLPDGAVTALLEDKAGSLWIGINGHGLSRLQLGASVAASARAETVVAPGMPATIYGMLEDGNGDLWLSSRKGVDRVSIAALEAWLGKSVSRQEGLAVTHYGSADGMRISEASGGGHPAAWRAGDGGLWFATLDGAAVVHPHGGASRALPPLSVIEQVLIDEQPAIQSGAALRVPPGHGRLSIRYAGLSFVAPQRVRYRYRLQGFDKSWVEAGLRRTAFYTNVPPGAYTFMVQAANGDGMWSVAAAEQRFTVEPFFSQTGWFYALVAVALAGFGYLVYRSRVVTVEARYRAVLEERSRIAREIHDTLAQGYVAIAVQLEIAERLLASSTAAALEQLKQTKEMVREGLAEARSSIWNLRSQTDPQALPSLLASHVASVARRLAGGTAIKFSVHGAYRPVQRSVEEEVLRIAQQAVANAVAHAGAALITVSLDYDAQMLVLRVADDGVGMAAGATMDAGTRSDAGATADAQQGHFGLQGMRERAARIEAPLEVKSVPGQGVVITLRVDLRRAARKDGL